MSGSVRRNRPILVGHLELVLLLVEGVALVPLFGQDVWVLDYHVLHLEPLRVVERIILVVVFLMEVLKLSCLEFRLLVVSLNNMVGRFKVKVIPIKAPFLVIIFLDLRDSFSYLYFHEERIPVFFLHLTLGIHFLCRVSFFIFL